MNSEYWGLSSDENFDEDGFARGLPGNHPTRAFIALANRLYGESKVKIRKDYTDEFSKHFMDKLPTVRLLGLTTDDPALNFGNVDFRCDVVIDGTHYALRQTLERRNAETQDLFDGWRFRLFVETYYHLQHKVQDLCIHNWEWQPPNHRLWVECTICGLKRDSPSGNRDWSKLFK